MYLLVGIHWISSLNTNPQIVYEKHQLNMVDSVP